MLLPIHVCFSDYFLHCVSVSVDISSSCLYFCIFIHYISKGLEMHKEINDQPPPVDDSLFIHSAQHHPWNISGIPKELSNKQTTRFNYLATKNQNANFVF